MLCKLRKETSCIKSCQDLLCIHPSNPSKKNWKIAKTTNYYATLEWMSLLSGVTAMLRYPNLVKRCNCFWTKQDYTFYRKVKSCIKFIKLATKKCKEANNDIDLVSLQIRLTPLGPGPQSLIALLFNRAFRCWCLK